MIKKVITLSSLAFILNVAFAKTDFISLKDGKVHYVIDQLGNRMLDYSYCGYRNSSCPIPDLPNAVYVSWQKGDNSKRIQKAIDVISSRKPDKNGYRGAVLLSEGDFELSESLRIETSGVVLRGTDKNKTRLIKQGYDRGAVIYIENDDTRKVTDTIRITSQYVPLNSLSFEIEKRDVLKPGMEIMIVRPSTAEWIESLGCQEFGGGISALGWKPGDTDIKWTRTVNHLSGNRITIDAPLSLQLDRKTAESYVLLFRPGRKLTDSGVENMTLLSAYDKQFPKDENHSWTGISIDRAIDCWVRNVSFKHFAGSAVLVLPGSSRITVEDCISRAPVSEIGGWRRQTFKTYGELTLFQRCYSEEGINDFSAGFCAPGPNAFVQCESKESKGFSGSVSSWACGLLFDIVNIDGHNLSFCNLEQDKLGAGWNTANSTFWQCTASKVECYSPSKELKNSAIGVWAQFSGNGEWDESNNHVTPRSLFYDQLEERGVSCPDSVSRILKINTSATSSPTIELATELAKAAFIPKTTLEHWIEQRSFPVVCETRKLKDVDQIKLKENRPTEVPADYAIINGRLTFDGRLLTGSKLDIQWWSGNTRDRSLSRARPHITRFVPGREGTGLTDRIDSVVSYMEREDVLAIDHNYGLWYERRRDDHERIRRGDSDVWAPFYEQPFDRSGQSTAWDGLSKYDLTKPNAWYWGRLKEFAEKSGKAGLLMFHQNYFQHNILEAGAHWVDFPWRTANNINHTGFPEPIHFAGDKRIFMADMFYDINDPVRRELHRKYIRKCLDNFSENPNVIQFISAEYTGPLHFVQFWLDEIKAWKKQYPEKTVTVALSTTKDVQDAILADKDRVSVVDIIDLRYWHYRNDGTLFAPPGGVNMAPRQHMRKMKVGKVEFKNAYDMVYEYRTRFPEKAVLYYGNNYSDLGWAVLMGGGSCPQLKISNKKMLEDIPQMENIGISNDLFYKIGKSGIGYIIYSMSDRILLPDISKGKYRIWGYDKETGDMIKLADKETVGAGYQLDVSDSEFSVFWFEVVK